MAEVLKGPAVGPDGDRFKAGQAVPSHWPDWFVADLRDAGQIASGPAKRAAAKPHPRKRAAKR